MRFTSYISYLLAFLVASSAVFAEVVEPKPEYGDIARVVADGLPKAHIMHEKLGDLKAVTALDLFLDSLDHDHTMFFADDVRTFARQVIELDDELKVGDVQFAYDVFNVFRERVTDRVAYVDELLEKGFDLEKEETYVWKRKDLPWPRDEAERDDLWRKKVKHEYVGHLVSKQLKEEKKLKREAEKKAAGIDTEENKELEDEGDDEPLTPEETIQKRYKRFLEVINGHDEEYVLQIYLNAFSHAYDSHSEYMSPRAHEDFSIQMKLQLTGIGALLRYEEGTAEVVSLVPGGPAEKDGRLQAGDRIVAVAQGVDKPVDIMYWPLYKSVRLIRGEVGTTVVLTVIPASDVSGSEKKKINIVRDVIKLEERAAKSEIREVPPEDDGTALKLGVLNLPDFYADQRGRKNGDSEARSSAVDVKKLLEDFNEDGVDGVVLDLRNNGGGSLPDAVEMTGHFIDSGPVVQVKANRRVRSLDDPNKGAIYDGPLVVLVNRQSASASEILAGALQDYGRAVIVGDSKTHGKGSVQSVFPVDRKDPKKGSLKLTTAGFYRVDGRTTQLKGVVPDVIVPSTLDAMEIGEEYLPNVLELAWVSPTRYRMDGRLMDIIPKLNTKSAERRANDPRFDNYRHVFERLVEKQNMTNISLNLEERIAMSRADQELDELQKDINEEFDESFEVIKRSDDKPEEDEEAADAEAGEDKADEEKDDEKEAKKKGGDLILNEALLVLRDLIMELEPAAEAEAEMTKVTADELSPHAVSGGIAKEVIPAR